MKNQSSDYMHVLLGMLLLYYSVYLTALLYIEEPSLRDEYKLYHCTVPIHNITITHFVLLH